MNVLIKSTTSLMIDGRQMGDGDEIGVFDSMGICCGAKVYAGNTFGITVWGQNSFSTSTDGMGNNELLRFRVWDSQLAKESPAMVTYVLVDPGNPLLGDSLYVTNSVSELASLISVPNAVLPRMGNANAYLFFTSGAVNYSLLHPEPVNLGFFDLLGRSALSINRNETAGAHRIGLQTLNLPQGLYVVRFKAGSLNLQQSLFITNHQN